MRAGYSKRQAEEPASEPPAKRIHPFFTKNANNNNEPSSPFKWLEPLGRNKTCLHGVNLEPKCSSKVAAFDLDGTIIKYDTYSNGTQWEWWHSTVLPNLTSAVEEGYTVVFLSNQAIKPGPLKQWKEKVPSLAASLKMVPFRIFAATAKDGFRKPMLGMWWELEKIFQELGVKIDLEASFFVGDAAGRQYKNQKLDFSSTDRKLALNIGIPFKTPEEYFLGRPTHSNYTLPGFHVSTVPDLPVVTPTSSPIIPPSGTQEIVVFCGYPALGKTHFFTRTFHPVGYTHINQDTLKTRAKCIKATHEALKRGESCVIDNTNRDIKTRKFYIDLAKEFKIPIRCFTFTGGIDLAWHNNLYRTFHGRFSTASTAETSRELVPYSAFASFREQYEEPTVSEGFSGIRKVNWKFEGTDEEKKNWSMWLQIDGK